MKPTEQQLTQWIDGTLSHAETRDVDAWLMANPQEKRELNEMRAISRGIAQAATPPADVPAAEFFTHQLERRLDELDRPAAKVAPLVVPWMRYFATSLAAAALAVFATIITMRVINDAGAGVATVEKVSSDLTGVYTPQELVKVDVFYSDGADAQVVILNGLPEVAAEVRIAGFGEVTRRSFYDVTFGSEIERMLTFVDAETSDVH